MRCNLKWAHCTIPCISARIISDEKLFSVKSTKNPYPGIEPVSLQCEALIKFFNETVVLFSTCYTSIKHLFAGSGTSRHHQIHWKQ
jgi:hypothetical protein